MKGIALGCLGVVLAAAVLGVLLGGLGLYRASLPQGEVCRAWPEANGPICIRGLPDEIAEAGAQLVEGQ